MKKKIAQDLHLSAALNRLHDDLLCLDNLMGWSPMSTKFTDEDIRKMNLIKDEISEHCSNLHIYIQSIINNEPDQIKDGEPFIKTPKKVSDIVSRYGHETQIWNKSNK